MFRDDILNSLFDVFEKHDCYLVGGYLRNYFMNNSISSDRDIVVSNDAFLLAKEIEEKTGGTFVELDCENEIYRVVMPDKVNYFDISRMLNDDISADAKRRDFTINAIFYNLNKKEIFDPLSGIDDIKNKALKTPDINNMTDDPLRMLRLYRFMSLTGFNPDNKLEEFCKKNFNLVLNCAPERIKSEIVHIFEGKYLIETLEKMFQEGVLEIIFPFVKEIKRIPPNTHHHLDLVHHSIETVKNIRTNKPLLKIAAFYHDIGKPKTWTIENTGRHRFIGHDTLGGELVREELKNLKFSTKEINYISKMVRYHIYPAALVQNDDTQKAFIRFVRKIGEDAPDLIELSRADRLSARGRDVSDEMVNNALSHLENLLNFYNKVSNEVKSPKSLLNGREIMELLNLKPSPKIGGIIDSLIEEQMAGNIKTKEDAIEFVKQKNI